MPWAWLTGPCDEGVAVWSAELCPIPGALDISGLLELLELEFDDFLCLVPPTAPPTTAPMMIMVTKTAMMIIPFLVP